jgi:hypothetical protein
VALIVALTLAWTGTAAQEGALAFDCDGVSVGTTYSALAHGGDKSDGSVDDHHLDDSPVQSGGDWPLADAIAATSSSFDPEWRGRSAVPSFRMPAHVPPLRDSQYRPPRFV